MATIAVDYSPHPKQALLHRSPANELLYGGAAGPGKSKALRMEALRYAMEIPGLQVYLFRRTFPELEDNHVIPSMAEYPAEVCSYSDQKHRWAVRSTGQQNSLIHLCHCKNEKDVFRYQGAEIHLLLIDELTTFTEFIYDYLRGRVRCTLVVPDAFKHKVPGIICASNPGGIGHEFVKRRWVDYAKPMELKRAANRDGGMLRQYIPGLLEDNPTLIKNDPEYIHRLDALPEPYRTAYKEGDWGIFLGQMFMFNRRDHVIDPRAIPEAAPVLMTFDWGFGKPYSVGWWWVDSDSRLYRFGELYGCMPGRVDEGVRETDDEIAEKILRQEADLDIDPDSVLRMCDPTCFNRKPNYMGGGQGPSSADVFLAHGLTLRPGDPKRDLKIREFHRRLRVPKDDKGDPTGEAPLLQVYSTCEAFIRTIPILQADLRDPEDVDTTQEDHVYDESALACMARPLGGRGLKSGKLWAE